MSHHTNPVHLIKNIRETKTEESANILSEIITDYSKDVYLVAYSFVKDHGTAEEISQDVFIKCFKYIDKFRGESSLKTWIYRITINTSKNYLRRLKFLNKINFHHPVEKAAVHSESPEEIFMKQNRKEMLLQLIFKLPTKYREVLVLYYFQDLKVEEISNVLRVNSNTVRTRLVRGRQKLKEEITSLE